MSRALPLPRDLVTTLERTWTRSARRPSISALASNLVGVWWGLRTAVLIDSCLLSGAEAQTLALHLEAATHELFIVHEPVSGQTLVVNRELLHARLLEPVSFVDVGSHEPLLLSSPPPAVSALLSSISSARTPFVDLELPKTDRPQELVALVGVLLDYPVAYSLGASQGPNCLGGRVLSVVEAALVDDAAGARQSLLSFSYPESLAAEHSRLAVAHLVQTLQLKLEARLSAARTRHLELAAVRVSVEHRSVVLDQVAL